ncbi:hypothetical protein B7494_g6240 [Chlorociboria aeruginascens]|nr:hypothetical protein B7494_g6240 [Chlorociboria aeruginascens]
MMMMPSDPIMKAYLSVLTALTKTLIYTSKTLDISKYAQTLTLYRSSRGLHVLTPLDKRNTPSGVFIAPQARTRYCTRTSSCSYSSLTNSSPFAYIGTRPNARSMATSNPAVPASVNAAPQPNDEPILPPVEASKRRAAYKAVEDYFDPSYKYIGIGSGSTVVYVVEAIAAKGRDITSKMIFVPTGDQSKQIIIESGLPLGSIDSLPPVHISDQKMSGQAALSVATGLHDLALKGKRESLDVAFDGADEIDEDLNCIKGDYRKLQPRLLTSWKTIPIEIAPLAAPTIKRILITLGSPDPKIRQGGTAKAGPVVTDNGMWIMDAPFPPLLIPSDLKGGEEGNGENGIWEVHTLGRRLKRITGVLEVGLFYGRNGTEVANAGEEGGGQKPIAAYFGMENGEVEIRLAKEAPGIVKSRP